MSPSRSAALVRHELRVLLSDPASMLSLTIMPIVMMAFFKPLARLALTDANPDANGSEYIVPAMTTMFAFFLVGYVGFTFFAEHRWNTWERLRASQAGNVEIIIGKVVPAMLLCLFQQSVLFGAGFLLFGLRVNGSLLGVLAICLALSLCLTSLGVLMAAVLKTEQQMNALSNLGAMILAGISGALVPLSVLPGWAQTAAPLTPQYWALRGFETVILDHGGVASIGLPVLVLLTLGVVCAGLALLRFRFDEPKVTGSAA
jgi:ABC-2 type transport system permease protein